MKKILNEVNLSQFNNQAIVGSAEHVLNYKCPGTCLDYVYDYLDTKYVFGWEIFNMKTNEIKNKEQNNK